MNASSTMPLTPLRIVARVLMGIVGGWVFVWGCIALGIPLAMLSGMAFDDSRNLTHLLAFLVYLLVTCWAFAAAGLIRVAVVLVGGGAAMTAVGLWLARMSH